jgi:hypothetical protein
MQIKQIVLYSKAGDTRIITLRLNEVNIITGRSGTGKSALSQIIEYSLGKSTSEIPVNVIRNSVSWYGLHVVFENKSEAFIARREPGPQHQSSSDIFVKLGTDLNIPPFSELRQTANVDGLDDLLGGLIGLEEAEATLGDQSTRNPYRIRFRHTRYFNYQEQGEVANRSFLFHKQNEPGMFQTLRDVLPYFLGALGADHVTKVQLLREENRNLKRLEREISQRERLGGDVGEVRASSLYAEALDLGLVSGKIESTEDVFTALTRVAQSETRMTDLGFLGDGFEDLESRRSLLLTEQREIKERQREYRTTIFATKGASNELQAQRTRLSSIDILDRNVAVTTCPLCESSLGSRLPAVTALVESVEALDVELSQYGKATPHLEKALAAGNERLGEIRRELVAIQQSITALEQRDAELARRRDADATRAFLRGRISNYVEMSQSVQVDDDLELRYQAIRDRIASLEESVGNDSIEGRLSSIISIMSDHMTAWARQLDLEINDLPVRLDVKKLTVALETPNGPVTMSQIGSAANWLGFHLIAFAALHKWFGDQGRPVPRFLFLDQPTQAFYKAQSVKRERLDESDDEVRVRRLFDFILELPAVFNRGFQIIVTDHEDREEKLFRDAVVENWHSAPNALIPLSWLT